MNIANFFLKGLNKTLKLINGTNLSYAGPWVKVYPNTIIDSWYVGDFSTATYLLTIEHDSNKKEVMHVNVVARPDQASYTIYGRTSIDDELIILDASVNNSIFTLKASPTDAMFTGVKVTKLVFYGETINPLTQATIASTGPGDTGGAGGNTEGGGTGGGTYTLPIAGTGPLGTLGGVKVDGTSITINSGVISSSVAPVSRSTISTTVNLAAGVDTTATVVMAKSYTLYSIQTSAAAWVTVYVNPASRTADASREINTDPLPGAGVVAEVITAGNETVLMSPAVSGYNFDTPTTNNAYLKIYNTSGSSSAITVTLTFLTESGNSSSIISSGSGVVNSGTSGRLAYYPATGTTVDDLALVSWGSSTLSVTGAINVSAQKNFVRFHWDTLADLNSEVSPVTWHGMLAHVHETGRVYVAHAAAWVPLALQSDIVSGGGTYTLPTATTSTLGGVKVDGSTITINGSGAITANYSTYLLPTATTSVLGGVKVDGSTITISGSGVISSASSYTLPTATTIVLGGVKVDGSTITINGSGVISASVTGAFVYKGTWNASTNTPTLTNGIGVTGNQYVVNVAGTQNFGAGNITFTVGDYVLYSGTVWQQIAAGGIAAAGSLTGPTLASNVVSSSLTSVGTLTNLTVTNTITGSVSGSAATVTSISGNTITSGQVTTGLGFTPYNATNPSGYISGIDSTAVVNALGFTPVQASTIIPAITRLDVTAPTSLAYLFNNQYSGDNPTIYAISGTTIAFSLNVAGHPFLVRTSGGSNYNTGLIHVSTTGVVSTGSNAQGKVSGTLYWQIPQGTSGAYQYICSNHGGMVGVITVKQISSLP